MGDQDIKHSDYVSDYTFRRESDIRHSYIGIKRYDADIKRDYKRTYGKIDRNGLSTDINEDRNSFGTYMDIETLTGDGRDIYVSRSSDPDSALFMGYEGGFSDILKTDEKTGEGDTGERFEYGGNSNRGLGTSGAYSSYESYGTGYGKHDMHSSGTYSDVPGQGFGYDHSGSNSSYNSFDIKHGSGSSRNGRDTVKKQDGVKNTAGKISESTQNAEKIKETGEAAGEYSNPYGYVKKGVRYAKKMKDKSDESFSKMEKGNGYDFTHNRRTDRRPSLNDLADTDTIKKILFLFGPLLLLVVLVMIFMTSILSLTERRGGVVDTGDPERYIVHHMRNEGYSDYAIACVMGGWASETGGSGTLNPYLIEGTLTTEDAKDTAEKIFNDPDFPYELNLYMLGDHSHIPPILGLFDRTFGYGVINDAYYVEGLYWPGFGVAQWTNYRTYGVLHYIGDGNIQDEIVENWYTISHQMEYFDFEMDIDNKYGSVSVGASHLDTCFYDWVSNASYQNFKELSPRQGETDDDCLVRGVYGFYLMFEGGGSFEPTQVNYSAARTYYEKIIEGYYDIGGNSLIWPIPGCYNISSSFGWREAPVEGASTYHNGIDISASVGTSVIASADGKVVFTGYNRIRGHYLKVDHGENSDGVNIITLYQHLSKIEVSEGDEVLQGQEIAKSGESGIGSGPHLHFEVQENGTPVNPSNYVSPE